MLFAFPLKNDDQRDRPINSTIIPLIVGFWRFSRFYGRFVSSRSSNTPFRTDADGFRCRSSQH